MDSDTERSTDRIMELPDPLLRHILSLLPTKYAVGTSFLSTRWKNLWTCVTSLDFDNSLLFHYPSGFDDHYVIVNSIFMNFVNRVLLLSDVPCLKEFCLRLANFHDFDFFSTWIRAVIKQNIQKVDLSFRLYDRYVFPHFSFVLPRVLFTSKTLEGDFLLGIPSCVCLPSLKILNLFYVQCKNENSAQNLFSGCPCLEELCISGFDYHFGNRKIWNIYVPTLKRLTVYHFRDDFYGIESIDESYKLVVNAPKLEHFHLSDHEPGDFSLVNLSSLLKAEVLIGYSHVRYPGSTNYGPCVSNFLRGIANVKFLDILTLAEDYVLPTFHNMTHLRLGVYNYCWNWDLLKNFLQCSPNLEVLIVEGRSCLWASQLTPLD